MCEGGKGWTRIKKGERMGVGWAGVSFRGSGRVGEGGGGCGTVRPGVWKIWSGAQVRFGGWSRVEKGGGVSFGGRRRAEEGGGRGAAWSELGFGAQEGRGEEEGGMERARGARKERHGEVRRGDGTGGKRSGAGKKEEGRRMVPDLDSTHEDSAGGCKVAE
eukprot:378096-Rhodomonas_salina.1